ncbi:MAG: hypothetical protein ACOYN0_03190 [Phycisphaerales bacterium]
MNLPANLQRLLWGFGGPALWAVGIATVTFGGHLLVSLLGVGVAFLGMALWAWFVHSAWSAVCDGKGSVSPEAAAMIMMVPVANAYWIHRAIRGYPREHNCSLSRQGVPLPRLEAGPAWWCALLYGVSYVPYFGLLPAAANIVVGGWVVLTVCESMERLAAASAVGLSATGGVARLSPFGASR